MSDLATLAAAAGITPKALAKITANLGPNGLGTASEAELRAHGVAPVLAKRLSAAIALGRTCVIRAGEPKAVIGMPALAAAELAPLIEGLQQELFFTIALDVRNRLLGVFEVARGTVASVEVHPREVFRPAIRIAAAGIVIGHNHPSGDPTPSAEDIALTHRLKEAGTILGIPVIDHIVMGSGGRFRSIAECF